MMVSPNLAELIACCRSPPAGTEIVAACVVLNAIRKIAMAMGIINGKNDDRDEFRWGELKPPFVNIISSPSLRMPLPFLGGHMAYRLPPSGSAVIKHQTPLPWRITFSVLVTLTP